MTLKNIKNSVERMGFYQTFTEAIIHKNSSLFDWEDGHY